MSDGVFRDDHEAAVARADALDRELARARSERDAARAEADQLRDRLDRPHTPPPSDTPHARRRRASAPGSFAGAISVMTVGLIAAGVAFSHGTRSYSYESVPVQAPVLERGVAAARAQAQQDQKLDACITIGRGVVLSVMSVSDVLAVTESCDDTLARALMDGRFSEDSRRELLALSTSLAEFNEQGRKYAGAALGDPSRERPIELDRAADELHEAANQLDVEALHLTGDRPSRAAPRD